MRRHFEREGPDRDLRLRLDVQETRGGVLWISSERVDRMGAKMKNEKSLLKSSYLKKYLPKFPYPKESRNRKFQPPKNPSIIHVT